jgi:mono/diheme cytochrome c family protein
MKRYLGHPFWQAALVLVAAFVLIRWGIAIIPGFVGVTSAPVPASVVLQYTLIALVGTLVWVSSDEERWAAFKEPIQAVLVEPERKVIRTVFMVLIPLLVAIGTFNNVRPTIAAPASLRSIHPAPPTQITFQGETMVLEGLENPMHEPGLEEAAFERGKEVYYENCMPCHGDYLNAGGHYAPGFNPTPLALRGNGTIAQLTESFVFWRIAKGGPGLPREGGPWNSAMPVWENFLSADDIWSVTLFLYEQAGVAPRTWEEEGVE